MPVELDDIEDPETIYMAELNDDFNNQRSFGEAVSNEYIAEEPTEPVEVHLPGTPDSVFADLEKQSAIVTAGVSAPSPNDLNVIDLLDDAIQEYDFCHAKLTGKPVSLSGVGTAVSSGFQAVPLRDHHPTAVDYRGRVPRRNKTDSINRKNDKCHMERSSSGLHRSVQIQTTDIDLSSQLPSNISRFQHHGFRPVSSLNIIEDDSSTDIADRASRMGMLQRQGTNLSLSNKLAFRRVGSRIGPMREGIGADAVVGDETEDDMYKEVHKAKVLRENVRARLGWWKLRLYDFRQQFAKLRSSKYDFVPIWRGIIKEIEGQFGTGVVSFFVFTRYIFLTNVLMTIMWIFFITLPQGIFFDYASVNTPFQVRNLLDGKGALGLTYMFYGGHSVSVGPLEYRLDFAYVTVIFLMFLSCFILIIRSMGAAFDPKKREAGSLVQQDTKYPFSMVGLVSWDHSLHSDVGIHNLKLGVANTCKDLLSDLKTNAIDEQNKLKKGKDLWKLIGRRVFAWVLTCCIWAGAITAIYFTVQISTTESAAGEFDSFAQSFGVPIIFSLINGIVPFVLKRVVFFDNFASGRTELNVTLFRIYSMRIFNIYVLMYSIYVRSQAPGFTSCAFTLVGQEFYRLVIIDTLVQAVGEIVMRFGYWYWFNKLRELDLTIGVLTLVYRQAMIWVGSCACPILPVVGVASNAIFFNVSTLIVKKTCRPPTKRWNQSRNNAFFLFFLALTLFLVAIPVIVVLTTYKPICGMYAPAIYTTVYATVPLYLEDKGVIIETISKWIFTPAFIFPIFVLLSLYIFYLRVRIRGVKQRNIDVEKHLEEEREDKAYLLRRANFIM